MVMNLMGSQSVKKITNKSKKTEDVWLGENGTNSFFALEKNPKIIQFELKDYLHVQ